MLLVSEIVASADSVRLQNRGIGRAAGGGHCQYDD
jgi:hypothetical protein